MAAPVGRVDGEILGQQHLGAYAPGRLRRLHTDRQIERSVDEFAQQVARGPYPQVDAQLGMIGPEASQRLTVVLDGRSVDHAEAQPPVIPGPGALSPISQVSSECYHLAGMVEDGLGVGSQDPAPTLPVEQRHADAAFEFRQALRESRRAHPDPFGGQRERVAVGHRHQVFELADGKIRQREGHASRIVQFCFTNAQIAKPVLILISMTVAAARRIAPATGNLGVLTPGMGAVASTFVAGVVAARRGLTPPIGSISQMAHIRLGTKTENRNPPIREFVPLAGLDDLVFGGWDPLSANVLEAARTCGVLEESDLGSISAELEGVVAMDAVFDRRWVSRLDGVRVKPHMSKWDQAQSLMDDIENFRSSHDCDRLVMVWCGSTEAFSEPTEVHTSVESFEAGLKADDAAIAPSQIYAYAALQSDVPFANGAPQSHRGPAVHGGAVPHPGRARRRQGLQDGPDPDEDADRARPQGPDAGAAGLVLHQHPGQPRR